MFCKRALPVGIIIFIFILAFIYLHQKVLCLVESYKLSNNYQNFKELVDKRDFLMYNFNKEITIAKINQWAQLNDFSPVDKTRIYVMNLNNNKSYVPRNKAVLLLSRLLNIKTEIPKVLAEDKE
jgi:hypothetical protein